MSSTIDNVTLAMISLKKDIRSYLDSNQWEGKFSIFLAGEKDFETKEIVEKVTDPRKQIGLPLIILDYESATNRVFELGSSGGNDIINLTILVATLDTIQLMTLANFIRRRLVNLSFTVYDTSVQSNKVLGTGLISDVVSNNMSDWQSTNIVDRHQMIISAPMEISFDALM